MTKEAVQEHIQKKIKLSIDENEKIQSNLNDITVVEKLHSPSKMTRSAAQVQRLAPEFTADAVSDGKFKTVSSSDFAGKYWVLFFYPLDFTFVCPTEITGFSDRIQEFRDINCDVVACSVDSKFSHLAWTKQPRNEGGLGRVEYPILADITKTIARDYGVLIENGDDSGVALRGLFIMDKEGVVRHITINDLPIGRSVDEVLRLVKAVQFADEHGEVCPIGWTPGKSTIKPNVEESKEFFSQVKN